MPHPPRTLRRSSRWLALVVMIIAVLAPTPALAASATSSTGTTAVVPTTPQNLRAIYRDGVVDTLAWNSSTADGRTLWYQFNLSWQCLFRTTMHLKEIVDSEYLEPGGTYTFYVRAVISNGERWVYSAPSNSLTVTVPWYPF